MKTYYVPICVTISGHIEVEAKNPAEAIEEARKVHFSNPHRDNYNHGIDTPCIDTDFCEEDEVEEA